MKLSAIIGLPREGFATWGTGSVEGLQAAVGQIDALLV